MYRRKGFQKRYSLSHLRVVIEIQLPEDTIHHFLTATDPPNEPSSPAIIARRLLRKGLILLTVVALVDIKGEEMTACVRPGLEIRANQLPVSYEQDVAENTQLAPVLLSQPESFYSLCQILEAIRTVKLMT